VSEAALVRKVSVGAGLNQQFSLPSCSRVRMSDIQLLDTAVYSVARL